MLESLGIGYALVSVDNTGGFQPISGSTFLINPKTRSNTESNPKRILNARQNNSVVESTWTGFHLGNEDGWITDGTPQNNKVLRVPAGRTLNIPRAAPLQRHAPGPPPGPSLPAVRRSVRVRLALLFLSAPLRLPLSSPWLGAVRGGGSALTSWGPLPQFLSWSLTVGVPGCPGPSDAPGVPGPSGSAPGVCLSVRGPRISVSSPGAVPSGSSRP